MASIHERPLSDDLPFGARICGVDAANIQDPGVRRRILEVFEARGVIIFEDMEPSSPMLLTLAEVFGPRQDHAMRSMPKVDPEIAGVIDMNHDPAGEQDVFEVDGTPLTCWLPWHYDACYTKELYRGAVLRTIVNPPEGGLTGFADGIQLYQDISPELRAQFGDRKIVYHAKLMYAQQRFGMPKRFRVIKHSKAALQVIADAETAPRAIHPAVWRRASGEKVLHVSPWQAAGIWGDETPEGDALFEALCQEMYAKIVPYFHRWRPTDMVVWDNWRMIHCVSGNDPRYGRRAHRANIKGDYGLGAFEDGAEDRLPLRAAY
jgi:taurine dioxygenase